MWIPIFLLGEILTEIVSFQVALVVKNLPAKTEDIKNWGQEDPPEKEMATHSSILAWKIPWTEKP